MATFKVLIFFTTFVIFTKSLYSLNPIENGKTQSKDASMKKLVELLSKLASSNLRREGRIKESALQKARSILELLNLNAVDNKNTNALREGADTSFVSKQTEVQETPLNEHAQVVEKELTSALAQKSSALLDKPYIEKKGINDFLVINDAESDPFATVVPNAIYYNNQKKCVNWLDNCSLDGIRAKLFQVMQSPY